jgi:hypothetical protein
MTYKRLRLEMVILLACTAVFEAAATGATGGSVSDWHLLESDLPGFLPRIVFYDSRGREVDAKSIGGNAPWSLVDEDQASADARAHWKAGMEAGGAYKWPQAMAEFRAAHRLSPRWAQPVYQGAWTALLMGDDALAETLYVWTDRLVPQGYWTAKSGRDCLERERLGEFPAGLYRRYVQLEFLDSAARAKQLETLVKEHPSFAPAWKDLSVLRTSDAGRDEAYRHGMAGRPDAETRCFLQLFRAQWLIRAKRADEASRILEQLRTDPATTLQVRVLSQLLR